MSLVEEMSNEVLADDCPNLKIEIENDRVENSVMETEDDDSTGKAPTVSSDTEEGELVDDEDRLSQRNQGKPTALNSQIVPKGRSILKYDTKEYAEILHQSAVNNPNGAFVTGVDVFSPEEQAKLDKRAQRFGIATSDAKVLTEKLLKKLYKSMCVKPTDENIRAEALHMCGTDQMTNQDIFSYFKDYGPASLERITKNSCNVVWLDNTSAARALLGLSVHISGQAAPASQPERRQSLSDSDVDMESQAVQTKQPEDESECLSEESDAVGVDEIGAALPAGRWRRGAPHPLSPCILLRFATTADRSLPNPGFAKFDNHQFGAGYMGLISESRKRRLQNSLPGTIMFDDVGDEIIPKPDIEDTDNANPWGILAKTWSQFDKVRKPRPPSPTIERILPISQRMTPPPSPPIFSSSRVKLVPHTRLRRERERATKAAVVVRRVSEPDSGSSDNDEWCSRSKMPRMRMHADDEEKKLEKRLKRRRLRSMSFSPPRSNDLRHRLAGALQRHYSDVEESPSPEPVVEEPSEDEEVPDLRVAVAADNPLTEKEALHQTLFAAGCAKSVLKGARGQSDNEKEEGVESDDSERLRVSVRRHRSRSKERRKHHRKHSSHHKSKRKDSDSDSIEKTEKTVKSAIRRKSPDRRDRHRSGSKDARSPRDRRSPHHERRRKEHKKSTRGDREDRRHGGGDCRIGRDLRAKLAHKHKSYDSNNEFRSKSPLQIEIDNDEYFKEVESD